MRESRAVCQAPRHFAGSRRQLRVADDARRQTDLGGPFGVDLLAQDEQLGCAPQADQPGSR